MSKSKKSKKKVVVTNTPKDNLRVKSSRASSSSMARESAQNVDLLFGKENYKWMLIGFAVIILGMFLMMGGRNPSPEIWDEGIIYSKRRTLLAPMVILVGLLIEIYAIFKKK